MRTQTCHCVIEDLGTAVELVIFGVEDVVVDSARTSAAAWKSVFDPFLRTCACVHETVFTPFDVRADYLGYVHGKPPLVGARDFLASREIYLPYDGLRGLAMSHEEFFLAEVRRHGLAAFTSAVALVRRLHRLRVRTAAVAAQACGSQMVKRAGVGAMFDVVLDGLDTPGTGLSARPDPRLYLQAARRLETDPCRAVVIEASANGLRAARDGGFGAVVRLAIDDLPASPGEAEADLVISDLADVRLRSAHPA